MTTPALGLGGRIRVAFQSFFRALGNGAAAQKIDGVLTGQAPALPPAEPAPKPSQLPTQPSAPKPEPKPARSEALTLLAALQREARLVDFLQEDVAAYTDAQVGAAARDVHRGCRAVCERMFKLQPVLAQEEGSPVELAPGFEAGKYQLSGKVQGEPPFRGKLVHHGWEAEVCDVPTWSGGAGAARVVAPAEVELA